jgi:hypothetical protein
LPALPVYGGDGGGAELQQIGQQNDFPLVYSIPDHHAPEHTRALALCQFAGKPDQLVRPNIALSGDSALFHDFVARVFSQTGHEEDSGLGPVGEQSVVGVAAVHGHNGSGIQSERVSHLDITLPRFGEQDIRWHVIVMIE